ncbi:hypothetical protein ACJ41O_007943 [Fusarium nematophilum]
MISHAVTALWKRDAVPSTPELTEGSSPPPWAFVVFLLNFLVFLPVFILLNYTLEKVFPVLAIVEDEKPPAYEPVPAEPLPAGVNPPKPTDPTAPSALLAEGRPVTSSIRGTWRLLRSYGGFRALFRGLPCLFAQSLLKGIVGLAVWAINPWAFPLADLISSVLLVQFSAAWVHIVITPHSPLRFWSRLPPFGHTLKATWRPVLIFWVVSQVVSLASYPIVNMLHLNNQAELSDLSKICRSMLGMISFGLLQILVLIPAYVLLIRVQASLLPEDHETIIPFDRSFNGRVEPAVVGGLGYATVRDAWFSFTKSAWRRIVILNMKIAAIAIAGVFLIAAVIAPQIVLIAAFSSKNGGNADSGAGGN